MSDLLCITNRRLCTGEFLARLEAIAAAKPAAIVLREKDLPQAAYTDLARRVLALCRLHGVRCILHSFPETAMALGAEAIHLPLPVLRTLIPAQKAWFSVLGASCHSVADALEAQALGCTYLTAGHIFDTDCKQGLPGRGLAFLQEVCGSVALPVYAIGGIRPEHMPAIRAAGAAGACVMSGPMRCQDPAAYFQQFSETEASQWP